MGDSRHHPARAADPHDAAYWHSQLEIANDSTPAPEAPPAPGAPGPQQADETFPFRFGRGYRWVGWPFGVRPGSCAVRVSGDELTVRFGPWSVRTPLANVASAELTGPFEFPKTAGPARVSVADRGLTFATNGDQGLCLRFHQPVRGIEPAGVVRHPALTVTVADCAGPRSLVLRETGANAGSGGPSARAPDRRA